MPVWGPMRSRCAGSRSTGQFSSFDSRIESPNPTMCKIVITICSECEIEMNIDFQLCRKGKNAYVCVGPNTSSGEPFLKTGLDTTTGNVQADMTTIAPTYLINALCEDCSAEVNAGRVRNR